MSYSTYKTLYELVDPVIVEIFLKKKRPKTFPQDVWDNSVKIYKRGSPILCKQFSEILALPWLGNETSGLDPFTYPAAIVLSFYLNDMKPVNILHTFLVATILLNNDRDRALQQIQQEIVNKLTDKSGLGVSSWGRWRKIFGKRLRSISGEERADLILEKLYHTLEKSKRLKIKGFYEELKSTLLLAAVFNKSTFVDPRIKKEIEKTIEEYEKRVRKIS